MTRDSRGVGRRHGPWQALPQAQRPRERVWDLRMRAGAGWILVGEIAWRRNSRDWVLRAAPELGGRELRWGGWAHDDWPMLIPGSVWDRARRAVAAWAVELAFEGSASA